MQISANIYLPSNANTKQLLYNTLSLPQTGNLRAFNFSEFEKLKSLAFQQWFQIENWTISKRMTAVNYMISTVN